MPAKKPANLWVKHAQNTHFLPPKCIVFGIDCPLQIDLNEWLLGVCVQYFVSKRRYIMSKIIMKKFYKIYFLILQNFSRWLLHNSVVSSISPKLALRGNFTLFTENLVHFSAKSPQKWWIFDGKTQPLLRKRRKDFLSGQFLMWLWTNYRIKDDL